jgi:low temperature requirement protein LtrA
VSASTVLRDRSVAAELEVTKVELFFDLVYVFAVTQLSQYLLDHLTGRGAFQTLVLFVAIWWAWNYTAWATNWVDPRHAAVRALLLVLMLFSLVMSAAIPRAFDGRAVMFAAAYVGLQAVRSAFMVAAYRGLRMGRN